MKKTFYLFFATLLCNSVFAQIHKGQVVLSLEGSLQNTVNNEEKSDDWLNGSAFVAPTLAYYVSDNTYVGLGVQASWAKNDNSVSLMSSSEYMYHIGTTKTKALLPYLFVGANWKLANRLYFGGRVEAAYGQIKIQTNDVYLSQVLLQDIYNGGSPSNISSENKLTSFAVQAVPEISYYFSNYIGTFLTLGNIGFANAKSDDESKVNYSTWVVDFSPSYWSLGIRLLFGS